MFHPGNRKVDATETSSISCREPSQDRARISCDRILSATRELIMELGHDDLTLNDVSARSGISVGSISFRFGAKENLLREAHIQALHLHLAQVSALSPEAGGAEPPLRSISRLVAGFAQIFRQNAAFLTAAEDRGRRDPEIALLAVTVERKSREILTCAFLLFWDEIASAHIRRKAEFAAKAVIDVLFRRAHSLLHDPEAIDRDGAQLAAMCLAYLRSGNFLARVCPPFIA